MENDVIQSMNCTFCGAQIPAGRTACETCGTAIRAPGPAPFDRVIAGIPMSTLAAVSVRVCPRCDYHGAGISYFSRGSHMAGLAAATIFTLPLAFGAGGILYYWLRRDHLVCPRCGAGWGKPGVGTAIIAAPTVAVPAAVGPAPAIAAGGRREGLMRGGSVALGVLTAILLTLGVVETELLLFVWGVLAAGGAFILHRNANIAREHRREALLASLQMNVLRLAGERQGRLTVTDVAASLAWPMRRAEKVLNSLDDGWRVNSTVTDDGVIVYEFRELLRLTD